MMKTVTALLLLLSALPVVAAPELVATLVLADGTRQEVGVLAVGDGGVKVTDPQQPAGVREIPAAGYRALRFAEPEGLTQAFALFHARRYREAKERFVRLKKEFQEVAAAVDSPAVQAAYGELECLRLAGDLEGLAQALPEIDKSKLGREDQRRQIDLDLLLWDAIRTKDWDRVEAMGRERLDQDLPAGQRVQLAYGLGLACEAKGRLQEAVPAYQTAITADAGESDGLARRAAEQVMRIALKDPEVLAAMKRWGAADERKDSAGYRELTAAAALADVYGTLLGGAELPEDLKVLRRYRPAKGKP